MLYQNYIWDFDGTIFDSYPHTCEVFWSVLGEEGLQDRLTKDELMAHLLVSFGDAKRFSGISAEGYKRFDQITHLLGNAETKPLVVPYPDCEKVLKAVVDAGGKNFIYTHRNATTMWYLWKYGMLGYFTDVVLSEEKFPGKPAPDALLALMERNGLAKEECIMVGDREIDGLSGKNAGIAGALVNYPDALPDGRNPAEVSVLDYTAKNLTAFAELMGIL
ncbi:MAG: HAD-IA family hydrolase [Clostridia bacterium]|nr:HAD-IA family hydrolase [Clostridia bacterium]